MKMKFLQVNPQKIVYIDLWIQLKMQQETHDPLSNVFSGFQVPFSKK